MLKAHVHPSSNYRKFDCQYDTKQSIDFLKQEAMFSSQIGLSAVFNPESEISNSKRSKSPTSEIFSQKDSKNLNVKQFESKSQDVRIKEKSSTFAVKDNSRASNTVELSDPNSKAELDQ